jgi:phosphatidylserine/phosphatidylglycerophosphate/cardiolipin synthase-like enzyme
MDKGAGASSCATGGEYCKLDGESAYPDYWNPRADVLTDPSNAFNLLHHKYTILDNGWPGAALWTGSFNWSSAANTVNDENSVIVHDPVIAGLYYQEWYARYRESGGVLAGVGWEPAAGTVALAQNRPNPTRGLTVIRFALPAEGHVSLGIYDLSGRRVRSLVEGPVGAGEQQVSWNGRSDDGAPQPAGIYFYRLVTRGRSLTRKLVLAR